MRRVVAAFSVLIVIGSVTPPLSAHDQPSDRAELKTEMAVAAARVRAWREEAKADFLRRKAERLLNPVSEEADRARRASDQVRNDFSLQKGDIVSTADGMFVFVGSSDGKRTPADFVPLSRGDMSER